MPNKAAKLRKHEKKKRREAIKKFKRDKKILRLMRREKKGDLKSH